MLFTRSAVLAFVLLVAPGFLFSHAAPGDNPPKTAAQPRQLGYLGLAVSAVNEGVAHELGASDTTGALVRGVQEGSPAAKAGLQPNDIITELNGKPLITAAELGSLVSETRPGHKVRLKVTRNGQTLNLTAILGARPAPPPTETVTRIDLPTSEYFFPDMPSPALRWRSSVLGVEYEGVDSQLAEFFGVKHGVLVRFVRPGSVAQAAGLRAGDILIKVDDKSIAGPRELAMALQDHQSGDRTLPVEIMRDRKQRTLTFKFSAYDLRTPWKRATPATTPQ
jgi:serine protease Do